MLALRDSMVTLKKRPSTNGGPLFLTVKLIPKQFAREDAKGNGNT
jgi:hypothetical protein